MKFLKSLFQRHQETPEPEHVFDAALAPLQSLFVVGDVHGCTDKLDLLLAKQPKDTQLVFVGDIVDRGPNVKGALERVFQACKEGAICLKGNHEEMLLKFLDDPTGRAKRWLKFGGLQTIYSYKIPRVAERSTKPELLEAAKAFRDALGAETEAWLRDLPVHFSSGNLHIVHAAADPAIPMESQDKNTFLWGHQDFRIVPRSDGQWVCHGHTIVEEAVAENGVISIDTGAYATDRLTAVLITPDTHSFITV